MPAPDGPTKATVCPGFISKVIFSRAILFSFNLDFLTSDFKESYEKQTSLNLIFPFTSQFIFLRESLFKIGSSGVSNISKTLS